MGLQACVDGGKTRDSIGVQLDLVSQLMQALLYLVTSTDSKERIVEFDSVLGSRKRKMRTIEQTCKLMKLDSGSKCDRSSVHELLLENLKKLTKGRFCSFFNSELEILLL